MTKLVLWYVISKGGLWRHVLISATGMITEWVALLCSVVSLVRLCVPRVQFLSRARDRSHRGSGSVAGALICSCAFLLALDLVAVFILVYQPGLYPGFILLLQNKATPSKKGRLDRNYISLSLTAPNLKTKGSLTLIETESCPL